MNSMNGVGEKIEVHLGIPGQTKMKETDIPKKGPPNMKIELYRLFSNSMARAKNTHGPQSNIMLQRLSHLHGDSIF